MNDVVIAKLQSIRTCVQRVREVDPGDLPSLERDQLRQESIVLNVQRACQSAIDLAVHVAGARKLGIPDDARDAFTRLERAGCIEPALAERLRAMVGFRNVAVHRYQVLDVRILRAILDERLEDLLRFAAVMEATPDL
jgi:uncharacterized protein YutE (UPF0331/DUF86 family)